MRVVTDAMQEHEVGVANNEADCAVDALLTARPDILAALAAEAGLVVLDPRSNVDIQRLGYALATEGAPGHTSYYVARALDRLAGERTR